MHSVIHSTVALAPEVPSASAMAIQSAAIILNGEKVLLGELFLISRLNAGSVFVQ
jgi:hypothetical protein